MVRSKSQKTFFPDKATAQAVFKEKILFFNMIVETFNTDNYVFISNYNDII